jgi:hypothetical protein
VRRAAERLPISSQGAASAFAASEPTVDMGGEFREVAIRNLSRIVQMFLESGSWPFPPPKPGGAGCRVPLEFLPPRLRPEVSRAEA